MIRTSSPGDTYIVTGAGKDQKDHPHALLERAFEMRKIATAQKMPDSEGSPLQVRIYDCKVFVTFLICRFVLASTLGQ